MSIFSLHKRRETAKTQFVTLLVCCLFLAIITSACRTTISVTNQAEFDGLQERLTSTIKAGKMNIRVSLLPGTYIAKEKHLTLQDIDAADTKIRIVGHGATLIPEGREYHDGEAYVETFSVGNSWMRGNKDVETWGYVKYADSLVEILDPEEKHCRLKCKNSFSDDTDFSNAYILIPHWFQSSTYKIEKIEGQYIYFTADDLKESSYDGYNVNDDYNYGKKAIRYKLCNIETGEDYLRITDGKVHLPNGVTSAWEGRIHNFLTFRNCKFSSVEIKGIQFLGNAFEDSNPAIYIRNTVSKKIRIHKCGFYGMRGSIISVSASPNVTIDNNHFEESYYYGIWSNNESANTVVEKNSFKSMGKRMNNTTCVGCLGTNYRVSDNVFLNFGYCGIRTGVWYKNKMTHSCSGIIEDNDLSYSQDYMDCIDNYGVMDGGAIYIATKNAGSIVRNNYIHGFSGMKHNRGIFCDDGASNIEIYGNVVTDIANSMCIDSRRVTFVERSNTPESGIDRANVNIVIRDNTVDGSIRFEAHEDSDNGCVKGANYVLPSKDGKMPKMVISNVANPEEDIVLNHTGTKYKQKHRYLK